MTAAKAHRSQGDRRRGHGPRRRRRLGRHRPHEARDLRPAGPGTRPRGRRHAGAVHDRLRDVWRAQRAQGQRHPRDPRSLRRRARGGASQRQRPAPRLVGHADRPRQGARHRQVLRHQLQRDRRLQRLDRAGLREPRHGPALRHRLPHHHDRRHGQRPGDAARPPRHREAARRRRRFDGRHAGARVGRLASRARPSLRAARHRGPPAHAGDRLQRGRPPGDHGRPRLARRPLLRRQAAGEGPQRGAHGRPHHLPQRRGHAGEVRTPPARHPRLLVHLLGRLRGGELPAAPGTLVHQPLRRQHVSLHHARPRLLRSHAPAREPRAGLPRRDGALPRAGVQQRLAAPARTSSRRSSAPCAPPTST